MTRQPRAVLGAAAGTAAALLLLAVASAVAAVRGTPGSDPFVAVGDTVVRLSPPAVTSWAIDTFGTADKPVLLGGIAVVVLLAAAGSGAVATRRPALGLCGPLLLVLAAGACVVAQPGAGPLALLPLVTGTALAAPVFVALTRRAARTPPTTGTGDAGSSRAADPSAAPTAAADPSAAAPTAAAAPSRRGVLLAGAAVAATAVAVAGAGRAVGRRLHDAVASRAGLQLPTPVQPVGPAPSGAQVSPVTAFRTPNEAFYRIDTALQVPRLTAEGWRLRVLGLVDRPLDLGWEDLLRFEVVEREITLVCVSNPVGGDLVGNAVWRGVRLTDVLERAGVQPGADMLLSRSVDGWTASTPTEAVLGNDDALLAFGMNGEPLPLEHGFPVRMVVPGLYGYVSATKWVTELRATTFADDTAFWTPRGYAERAPVKVGSRIDVPGSFERLEAGPVVVAGVAWAPGRGVDAVELRVDDERWRPAELAPVPGATTWQQWRLTWDAPPGQHRLQVRATTSEGEVQTADRAPIQPDGATGRHSVVVTVG